MDAQKMIDCLKDLYQEGRNNGMDYAGCLEFGCGKSELSIQKEKQIAVQNTFRDIMNVLQDYLEQLRDNIACEIQTEYFKGVEVSYIALIKQFQIWKKMELND
jgi:hypothetical protein